MYLAALYILLNLDTEVSSFDRERVLRSLRERIKGRFGHSVTVRTEADTALVVAFLEDRQERLDQKSESIIVAVEEAGEARILSVQKQVFAWDQGEFRELEHEASFEEFAPGAQNLGTPMTPMNRSKYHSEDDDDTGEQEELLQDMTGRFSRRSLRLPVRK